MQIRQELENLRSQFIAHSGAFHHVSGGIVRIGEATEDQEGHWPKEKLRVQRQLHDRHVALNLALAKYAFRPRATYVLAGGTWIFGMVPDDSGKWFQMNFGNDTVSEADAVLSLVRLAETGDLEKLRLCAWCKVKWMFAGKRSYRFCSDKCRELFYASSPDYHSRKAATQRKYRDRLKRNQAVQEAFSKEHLHGQEKAH